MPERPLVGAFSDLAAFLRSDSGDQLIRSPQIDEHGHLFPQRTDEQVQSLLSGIGHLITFQTWG